MATTNLKLYLKTLSEEELIKHIVELDKKFKPVQEVHQLLIDKDSSLMVQKYKQAIENEFYPVRGLPKMRLSEARKAISDAKKLGLPPEIMAELMLFYVETGVQFTCDYGDIDEPFYNSMESMYLKVLKYMADERLLSDFKFRAKDLVDKTVNIGWGFHDTLGDYYFQFYE